MPYPSYTALNDKQLAELLFIAEDRLELAWAQETARRSTLTPYLTQIIMDKANWISELPEWWAVIHSTYIIGFKGGKDAILPLLSALRWADAFDCDWVTEVLPSIFGWVGPIIIPKLTMTVHDLSAGWSARDIALKGLAAISLTYPKCTNHVFQIIGKCLMDENENRILRLLAGQILLDFRCPQYRIALLKFSREEWDPRDLDAWYPISFNPNDVEMAFRHNGSDTWYYQEDWMRFYQPAEIQRRQKRWTRERLGISQAGRDRILPQGGGRILNLPRIIKSSEVPEHTPPISPNTDPKGHGQK